MEEIGKINELKTDQPEEVRWYEKQISLDDAKAFIRANITTAARSFIAIGFYLKCVRDRELFLEDGYQTVWEFAKGEYGISKSTASRYMTMNDRFSENGNSPIVKEEYKAFGKSQLQEMLALSDEQIDMVKPTDRVEDIRSMRKPKEIPYIELPGQMEIEKDFLQEDIDNFFPEEEFEIPPMERKQEFSMDISELVVNYSEEQRNAAEKQQITETIAISQQEPVQPLSAYGTSIKVYPEDSRIAIAGCNGPDGDHRGSHDCISCHLQCDIRQKFCYCVEAPMGNPFPCDQIDRIDSLREDIGERCQFVDLDLAYHRAGDHEPVPCCKECKEPCQYACERSIKKREAEEQSQEPEAPKWNTNPTPCIHQERYSCTVPDDKKRVPGDGSNCGQSCCWECQKRGECKWECNSSQTRPEEPDPPKQISELDFSCRTENTLKRAGIDTVDKLASMSDKELAAVRGMSTRTLEEIRTKLEDKPEPETVVDAEYEEVQPDHSERVYTLEEVAQEIYRLEAAYMGAPEEVRQSNHYRKNMMRLDAMRLLYEDMI